MSKYWDLRPSFFVAKKNLPPESCTAHGEILESCITKRFCINKENIINNLRIKSMVYNFIIYLSAAEVITNISFGVAQIGIYDLNIVSGNPRNISNSCQRSQLNRSHRQINILC